MTARLVSIEADGPYKAAFRLCEALKDAYIAGAMTKFPDVDWAVSDAPVSYAAALAVMDARARAIRDEGAQELVWFLEHPPLYTAGTSAKPADLKDPARFPVFDAGRGGQYTYHGPAAHPQQLAHGQHGASQDDGDFDVDGFDLGHGGLGH